MLNVITFQSQPANGLGKKLALPERSTSITVQFRQVMGEEGHQGGDATKDTSLVLGGVIHVTQVL